MVLDGNPQIKKEYPYREYLLKENEFRCNLRVPEYWPICDHKEGCNKCSLYLEDLESIEKENNRPRGLPYFVD